MSNEMTNYSTMVAGPELDAAAAEGVMGWGLKGDYFWVDAEGNPIIMPKGNGLATRETFIPSDPEDWRSIGMVLDRLAELKIPYGLEYEPKGDLPYRFITWQGVTETITYAETPQVAATRGALKAVGGD
ncbi:hypothetical protein LCGC14_0637560 [marine sediment metagenome]|uniref:Phage ABA sandwich domain-containing protein n=1 Tax=marine sediment metagenome TaxID=412755 RepID=A0A0F9R044_9ZZZZ